MQALNLFISHGALQDSAARYPPPRCFPGTRKKEKEIIRRWIEEPNPCSSVFLIQGRTGVGKTALMQTIAEQLQAENRQPYACFFFKRGVVGCDNMDQLFSTLAYQLAINIPSMREHIEQAMMEDPALPMRSPATQLQKLIIIPFKLLPTPRSSPILIIDGLDECEGEESQDAFLALISQVLEDPAVTIQFIVSGLQGQEYERVVVRAAVSFWIMTKRTRSLYTCPSTLCFFFLSFCE
jgi:Cdc6-like AAA superfamily ATPase